MESLYNQPDLPDKKKRVRINKEKYEALKHPARTIKTGRGKEITDLPGEIWKEWKPNYFVSNLGRAKVKKTFNTGEVKEFQLLGRKGDYGRPVLEGHGALSRLVKKTFDPHPDQDKLFVIHIDGNYQNCHIDNLKYVETRHECFVNARKFGHTSAYVKTKKVVDNTGAVKIKKVAYSDEDVLEIRKLYKVGISMVKIAQIMKCSTSYVSRIVNNKHRVLKSKRKTKPKEE
jgi:hypothetical protein